jgi:phage repressor protein C with HTH and peptisase S24 domain
MEYPNNLYALRTAGRKSQQEIADALSISQSEYSRMEKGRRTIDSYVPQLAKVFNVDEKDITTASQAFRPAALEHGYITQRMPVYGNPDESGGLIWTERPIDMVDKPASMSDNADAYAVYMPSDVMAPRINAGETLFVDPHMPKRSGQSVVVSISNSNVRHILEYRECTPEKMIFFRYNPGETVEFLRNEVESVHVIRGVRFF